MADQKNYDSTAFKSAFGGLISGMEQFQRRISRQCRAYHSISNYQVKLIFESLIKANYINSYHVSALVHSQFVQQCNLTDSIFKQIESKKILKISVSLGQKKGHMLAHTGDQEHVFGYSPQ